MRDVLIYALILIFTIGATSFAPYPGEDSGDVTAAKATTPKDELPILTIEKTVHLKSHPSMKALRPDLNLRVDELRENLSSAEDSALRIERMLIEMERRGDDL